MGQERRKYLRIEAKVQVTFSSREELIQEYSRNISKGGIFIKTSELLDPNADISLTLKFPENLGEFKVIGKVVRLITTSHPSNTQKQLFGAGVKFLKIPPEMEKVIESMMGSKTQEKS